MVSSEIGKPSLFISFPSALTGRLPDNIATEIAVHKTVVHAFLSFFFEILFFIPFLLALLLCFLISLFYHLFFLILSEIYLYILLDYLQFLLSNKKRSSFYRRPFLFMQQVLFWRLSCIFLENFQKVIITLKATRTNSFFQRFSIF